MNNQTAHSSPKSAMAPHSQSHRIQLAKAV